MATLLKVSTTVTLRVGPFLDVNGAEKTALTPAFEVSKNNGAFAARNSATAVGHDSNAWYTVELNTTDTNTLGRLVVKSDDAANHLPVWNEFVVVPAVVYDALVAGTDNLDVSLVHWLGSAPNSLNSGNVQAHVASAAAASLDGTNLKSDTNAILVDTAAMQPKVDELHDNRLTGTRAGYLDKLNIAGNVASSAEVTAIQNNTRVVRVVPTVIERPDSGTQQYRIELFLYDSAGNMEVPDFAPTIALTNAAGTNRASRLDSTTMALEGTGHYRALYTADAADALEQLLWVFSVIEGGQLRQYGNTSLIVDTTAVDFTAADRTKLDTLHDTRIPGVIQPQSGDAYARLGAPAGASIAADIAAVRAAAAADVLIDTTIDGLSSQTVFTLVDGAPDNGAYFGQDVIIFDAVTAHQKSATWVQIYTASTKTLQIAGTPAFTIAPGDRVVIKASSALRATVHNRTLDVSAAGNAGVDWANVASPTTSVNLSGTTVGTVSSVTAFSAAAIASIWDALTSGMSTAGSIGKKLADWVVGQVTDLTQAALAKFATTDTGQTSAAAGSVAQLSQGVGGGGGGSTTVVMGPLVAVREPGNRIMSPMTLEMWKSQTKRFDIAVVDANGDNVDLTGKTLRFVVGDTQPQPVGVFDVEAAGITIADNVASVVVPGASASTASTERQWWLWSLNDPAGGQHTVLAWGPFAIRAAVLDVA